jgi:hypothetical protein
MQTGSAANLDKSPCRRGGPYVFESLDDPFVLSGMTRPRADMREAKLLQELSDTALVEVDAKPFGDDAFEVDPPPAHDPILLAIRLSEEQLAEASGLRSSCR